MQHILVINAGSSSVKLSVFEASENDLPRLINARAVKLFHKDAQLTIYDRNKQVILAKNLADISLTSPNHKVAIEFFLGWLSQQADIDLIAVAHRVVHGGPKYIDAVLISDQVIDDLKNYQALAPLHQQHNLAPINTIKELYKDLPQIACFDTAFHQTMPDLAKRFALPEKYFADGVRRYGFHGLSYEYIVNQLDSLNEYKNTIVNKKIIIAHLGNGASMCAIRNKRSIATTMSFTPLDGLVMGTRCGDLDPGVVLHLMSQYSMTVDEISSLLYKHSGMLGVSGTSNNMRELLQSKTKAAALAIDLFCFQANRHIGALTAELGGLDQLIFTAGIGENSSIIREKICKLAQWLGIHLDPEANNHNKFKISNQSSAVEILRIPTNEALMIAKHALNIVHNS